MGLSWVITNRSDAYCTGWTEMGNKSRMGKPQKRFSTHEIKVRKLGLDLRERDGDG
jgi:hypothetical protein